MKKKTNFLELFLHLLFCVATVLFFRNYSCLRPGAFGALYKEYITGVIVLFVFYLNYLILYPRFYSVRRLTSYVLAIFACLLSATLAEQMLVHKQIFEIVKDFVEKEKPEENVAWYKDEEGEDVGPKYGEKTEKVVYPELKGKYIMDLIKEIYNFYTKVLPELEKEQDYLEEILDKYVINGYWADDENDAEMVSWVSTKTKYTLEDLEKENINWDIVLKYLNRKEDILDKMLLTFSIFELDSKIYKETQYYLHLAVDVRAYLWT